MVRHTAQGSLLLSSTAENTGEEPPVPCQHGGEVIGSTPHHGGRLKNVFISGQLTWAKMGGVSPCQHWWQ